MVLIAGLCLTLTACGGGDDAGDAGNSSSNGILRVSSSVELLGTEHSTTTITVSAPQGSAWTVAGVPDWLSLNKSGVGSSTVTITATSENFSDTPREAQIVFTTSDNSATAVCTVSQKGVLAANCRVSIGDMTIMSDGFAGDLIFDADCKGYREYIYTASQFATKTEKDIFNELMEQHEYERKDDYFISPSINPISYPEAELVYCVAAYGSEYNTDGSHKYGPVTVKRVKTKAKTIGLDMVLSTSYTSSQWNVTATRQGSYGQMCNYYYYLAGEGEAAKELFGYWNVLSDAAIAHIFMKPMIEKEPEKCIINGPQTMHFARSTNKFICFTWGQHKDTGEFSAELSATQYPSGSLSGMKMQKLNANIDGVIEIKEKYTSKKDFPKFNLIAIKK